MTPPLDGPPLVESRQSELAALARTAAEIMYFVGTGRRQGDRPRGLN